MDFETCARRAGEAARRASGRRPELGLDAVLRRGRQRTARRRTLQGGAGLLAALAVALVVVSLPRASPTVPETGLLGAWTTTVTPAADAHGVVSLATGPWLLTVTRTTLTAQPVGRPADLVREFVRLSGHRLQILAEDETLFYDLACAGLTAAYTWQVSGATARLSAADETCPARRVVLSSAPWTRSSG